MSTTERPTVLSRLGAWLFLRGYARQVDAAIAAGRGDYAAQTRHAWISGAWWVAALAVAAVCSRRDGGDGT